MYRVSDVLKPGFQRSWHEAVALVQEVAAQLAPGASVPEPEDLLLDGEGVLRLGFRSNAPQNQVSALASLLKSLLDGIDAPPALRELAKDNATASPVVSSLDAFQRALAFYERPGREAELRELAARLGTVAAVVDPEAEFERLREKVAAKAEPDPAAEPAQGRKRVSRKKMLIVAAVELALLAAIVAYARPQYFRSARGLSDRLERRLADTIAGRVNGDPTASVVSPAPVGTAEAPEPRSARSNAEKVEGPTAAGAAASPSGGGGVATAPAARHGNNARAPVVSPSDAEGPVPAPPAAAPVTTGRTPAVANSPGGPFIEVRVLPLPDAVPVSPTVAPGVATYSSADRDVEPPVLYRPQLPRQPEPGEDTGYFDVIVTEVGEVERVQLVSPMRRFQERMLMAAAKAWLFRPAKRNGQPVRYRLRIAIILSDKA